VRSFEGLDLLHTCLPDGSRQIQVLRLADVHRLVLHLLGPTYERAYLLFTYVSTGRILEEDETGEEQHGISGHRVTHESHTCPVSADTELIL
jgi:hypothetical protein